MDNTVDTEIEGLKKAYYALCDLPPEGQERALDYLRDRINEDQKRRAHQSEASHGD